MRDRVKNEGRFGRKAIAAVLRHHRQKPMLRYLEYLKSDSRPITEEERLSYRPSLKQWWFEQARAEEKG